jgi:hypothetical protein
MVTLSISIIPHCDVNIGNVINRYDGPCCDNTGNVINKYEGPCCDKWVPVTTAWRVLRLLMEERPPEWRVAANILNKQLRTADKVWCLSLGVGRGAKKFST